MNWTKLSERKPTEQDCPSGRVLIAWEEEGRVCYGDWGIRSPALVQAHKDYALYWLAIPVIPEQKPFWYQD